MMESIPIYSIAAFAFPAHTSFLPPYHMHQRPTHPRLHVRDVRDALILLEAVRLGILKPVGRRLNDAERSMYVRSGTVFVWEESEDDAGIKRWTDGCMWSQSRMREPFLFYEEKLQDDRSSVVGKNRSHSVTQVQFILPYFLGLTLGQSSESSSSSIRSLTPSTLSAHSSSASQHSSVPQAFSSAAFGEGATYGPGLVKQAYSAYVTQPGTTVRKKFHLTAYFTYADLPNLPTLESEPTLWNIVIPQGIYRSGKSRTSGRNLANAAEPVRVRQTGGDSSPSPTSSPSSIGHSPLAQWSGTRRGSASYFDPPSSDHHNSTHHHHAAASRSAYPGHSHPSMSPTTPRRSESYASVPRLPPVTSLATETDALRRNRNSEDNRVISMLNSRPIP